MSLQKPRAAPSDRFRRQHDELLAMAAEILAALDPQTIAEDAARIRRLVSRFSGKLLVHAEMENGALYPRLLHHHDESVRSRATALYEDVKRIYASFEHYSKRWPSAEAIAADAPTFVKETHEILKVLGVRLKRENQELYPLADAED